MKDQKTVLQYLEANTRFHLSINCISYRKTEKLVPLHINELGFENKENSTLKMSINYTRYSVSTYRHYPLDTVVPWLHQKENDEAMAITDIDKFGLIDRSADSILSPGDVELGQRIVELQFLTEEEQIEDLENYASRWSNIRPNKLVFEKRMDRLQSLRNKRDNIPVAYNTMAQLTVQNRFGKTQKYYFNGKIYQAEKSLNNLLFGNRKGVITVGKLHLNFAFATLRLPIDMKLKIRELKTIFLHSITKGLRQLLNDSSVSLNLLELVQIQEEDFNNDILTNAKLLILKYGSRGKLELLQNLKVDVIQSFLIPRDVIQLIQQWKNTNRPIGTWYRFGVRWNDTQNIESVIKEKLNGRRIDDGLVEIPLNTVSKLMLSYKSVLIDFKYFFNLIIVPSDYCFPS